MPRTNPRNRERRSQPLGQAYERHSHLASFPRERRYDSAPRTGHHSFREMPGEGSKPRNRSSGACSRKGCLPPSSIRRLFASVISRGRRPLSPKEAICRRADSHILFHAQRKRIPAFPASNTRECSPPMAGHILPLARASRRTCSIVRQGAGWDRRYGRPSIQASGLRVPPDSRQGLPRFVSASVPLANFWFFYGSNRIVHSFQPFFRIFL